MCHDGAGLEWQLVITRRHESRLTLPPCLFLSP